MIINTFASKYYKKNAKLQIFMAFPIKRWLMVAKISHNNRKPLG